MLISFFQQDLVPAHTAKSTKSWLNDHAVVVLVVEGHCQINLGFHTPSAVQVPSIEYMCSKLTYFPEGQQFTKNVFFIALMKHSIFLR